MTTYEQRIHLLGQFILASTLCILTLLSSYTHNEWATCSSPGYTFYLQPEGISYCATQNSTTCTLQPEYLHALSLPMTCPLTRDTFSFGVIAFGYVQLARKQLDVYHWWIFVYIITTILWTSGCYDSSVGRLMAVYPSVLCSSSLIYTLAVYVTYCGYVIYAFLKLVPTMVRRCRRPVVTPPMVVGVP